MSSPDGALGVTHAQGTSVPLRKTPLDAQHRAIGAKMSGFAGWDMPLEYSGIVREHMAVRTRVGVFDVSHMGQIEVAGSGVLAAVQRMTSNDASRLSPGRAQYSCLTSPCGTVIDDIGFEMIDRGIARWGHPIYINGQHVGVVTSGTYAPYLKRAIGMGYL